MKRYSTVLFFFKLSTSPHDFVWLQNVNIIADVIIADVIVADIMYDVKTYLYVICTAHCKCTYFCDKENLQKIYPFFPSNATATVTESLGVNEPLMCEIKGPQ